MDETGWEEDGISRCEQFIQDFMTQSRYKKILTQLKGSNLLIKCAVCPIGGAGGGGGPEGNSKGYLEISPLQITICTNKLNNNKKSYEELLSHELIHAYDYLLKRCDFHTCEGLAYSEVRAAREGECSGYFLHNYFQYQCIKDHAIKSTANLFPKKDAKECVEKVFYQAMKDKEPFDR